MVTAELAVALPALVLAVVAGLVAIATQTAQLRCADAAAVAARLAARGETRQVVTAAAGDVAPAGATVVVREAGDSVRVTVATVVRTPGAGPLPGIPVSAVVTMPREPGEPP